MLKPSISDRNAPRAWRLSSGITPASYRARATLRRPSRGVGCWLAWAPISPSRANAAVASPQQALSLRAVWANGPARAGAGRKLPAGNTRAEGEVGPSVVASCPAQPPAITPNTLTRTPIVRMIRLLSSPATIAVLVTRNAPITGKGGQPCQNPTVERESDQSKDITELLRDWRSGSEEALERLMPVVYEALRTIASRHMARERRDGTLATTALVHEAYLRLVNQRDVDWQNRAHFFAIAARVMRRIVVDEARRRRRAKRGGGAIPVQYESPGDLSAIDGGLQMPDILALDRALTELEATDPSQGRVVELKFFGGLTVEEIAVVMKTSTRTVKREWAMARAWLYQTLQEGSASLGRRAPSDLPRTR